MKLLVLSCCPDPGGLAARPRTNTGARGYAQPQPSGRSGSQATVAAPPYAAAQATFTPWRPIPIQAGDTLSSIPSGSESP